MNTKKAKQLNKIAYTLWFNSDRKIAKEVIYKAMKKEYKEHKGK